MNPSVMKNLTYGMYAIGVTDGEKPSACIVNAVAQISRGNPCLIAVSINKNSHSCACIQKNGIFTISVLSEDTPGTVIGVLGLVSGKNSNKLRNIRHKVLIEGVPVIKENTCCWLLCKLVGSMEIENQMIFAAEITAGSDISVGVPMTYDYYRNVLKGTATFDSPVYFPPDSTFDRSSGESFVCSVCGYTYNDPNFSFEELEDAWKCPVCKMPKKAFIRR